MDNLSAVISFPRFIRDLATPCASRASAGGFCYLVLNRGRERIETRMNGITTCTSQNVPPGFIAGSSGDTIPNSEELSMVSPELSAIPNSEELSMVSPELMLAQDWLSADAQNRL